MLHDSIPEFVPNGATDPSTALYDAWRDAVTKYLSQQSSTVSLAELSEKVTRPIGVHSSVQILDVLITDPLQRFAVSGEGESTRVRRIFRVDDEEIQEYVTKWRNALADYLSKLSCTVGLSEIGSNVSRPHRLPSSIKLIDVLKADPLNRFVITGEGNGIRAKYNFHLTEEQIASLVDQWREQICRYLTTQANSVGLSDIGSNVARPFCLPNSVKLLDTLISDPKNRFAVSGEGSNIRARRVFHIDDGEISHYVDEWRQNICDFLLVNSVPMSLSDIGSNVVRPPQLPVTVKLTDVMRSDPFRRFHLTGEGNNLRAMHISCVNQLAAPTLTVPTSLVTLDSTNDLSANVATGSSASEAALLSQANYLTGENSVIQSTLSPSAPPFKMGMHIPASEVVNEGFVHQEFEKSLPHYSLQELEGSSSISGRYISQGNGYVPRNPSDLRGHVVGTQHHRPPYGNGRGVSGFDQGAQGVGYSKYQPLTSHPVGGGINSGRGMVANNHSGVYGVGPSSGYGGRGPTKYNQGGPFSTQQANYPPRTRQSFSGQDNANWNGQSKSSGYYEGRVSSNTSPGSVYTTSSASTSTTTSYGGSYGGHSYGAGRGASPGYLPLEKVDSKVTSAVDGAELGSTLLLPPPSTNSSAHSKPIKVSSATAAALASLDPTGIPPEYFCPISHQLMKDPVQAADGNTYERKNIEDLFLQGISVSPVTKFEFPSRKLTANSSLRQCIENYVRQRLLQMANARLQNPGTNATDATNLARSPSTEAGSSTLESLSEAFRTTDISSSPLSGLTQQSLYTLATNRENSSFSDSSASRLLQAGSGPFDSIDSSWQLGGILGGPSIDFDYFNDPLSSVDPTSSFILPALGESLGGLDKGSVDGGPPPGISSFSAGQAPLILRDNGPAPRKAPISLTTTLALWLPELFHGFDSSLVQSFVDMLRDEGGFVCIQDIAEAHVNKQLTFEFMQSICGMKLGHYNRLIKGLTEVMSSA